MKIFLLLLVLVSSKIFAYIHEPTGDYDLDALSARLQQQDIENRLDAIESRQQQAQDEQWQNDMFGTINKR